MTSLYNHFKSLSVRITAGHTAVSSALPNIPMLDTPVTAPELVNAIQKISALSSGGGHDICTAAFKKLASNVVFLDALTPVFNDIFETGNLPPEWLDGTLVSVPKKGNFFAAENCRPLVVELLPARILSSVLSRRVKLWADIDDDQGGF